MISELPATNLTTLFLLLIQKRRRFRVVGESMLPLLQPGEEILIDPAAYVNSLPQVNDIVIISHPRNPELTIVKRVTEVGADGRYFVRGDNLEASIDSRQWGKIELNHILGKVTNRFI